MKKMSYPEIDNSKGRPFRFKQSRVFHQKKIFNRLRSNTSEKKGSISAQMKQMGKLSPDERKDYGFKVNETLLPSKLIRDLVAKAEASEL